MGAAASALRSGSEITIVDWGEDWIDYALSDLEGMEPLRDFASRREWTKLDDWLAANENDIIRELQRAFAAQADQEAEQAGDGDA